MNETTDTAKHPPARASLSILAMTVLGAVCVLVTGAEHPLVAQLTLLLLAAGALVTFYHYSHSRNGAKAQAQTTAGRDSQGICDCGQASLYRYALPTWAGQVETARTLTEEAITTLVNHFSRMSQRVERATATARSGTAMSGGLTLLLGKSRQELEATVVSLRAALATKEALQYEVAELSRLTEQLRAMALDLENIAEQTKRVALNAALAEHGGQNNQGLALVAHEIGELCSQCSETGQRINETVDTVNAAITSSLAVALEYTEQDGATVNLSRQTIEHVIKRFRGATSTLLESSRELREESQAVGQEITQVLLSLQFQQHVTQVLDLVSNDLKKLHLSLAQADTLQHQPQATAPRLHPSRAT